MSMSKQITQNQEDSVMVNEEISKNCSCSESFFDKKLITACLMSALIAGIGVFAAVKLEISSAEKSLEIISKNYEILDEKLKNIKKLAISLEQSIVSIQQDAKSGQDNFAYIYSKIASLQKDISYIKDNFHIGDMQRDTELQNMPADQISFIESFETLIKEGAPLEEFLKSFDDKVDITTYVSGKDLLEFKGIKVLSADELQKVFANIGQSEFGISLNETFWEKQKRIIKEKFVNAITIKKNNENSSADKGQEEEQIIEQSDDKTLFAKASEYMKEGKIIQAVAILEKIEKGHADIAKFISKAKQRIALDEAFAKFKKEFISVATNTSKEAKSE